MANLSKRKELENLFSTAWVYLCKINKIAGFDSRDPPLRLARSGSDTGELAGQARRWTTDPGASEQETVGERLRKQSLDKDSEAVIPVEV